MSANRAHGARSRTRRGSGESVCVRAHAVAAAIGARGMQLLLLAGESVGVLFFVYNTSVVCLDPLDPAQAGAPPPLPMLDVVRRHYLQLQGDRATVDLAYRTVHEERFTQRGGKMLRPFAPKTCRPPRRCPPSPSCSPSTTRQRARSPPPRRGSSRPSFTTAAGSPPTTPSEASTTARPLTPPASIAAKRPASSQCRNPPREPTSTCRPTARRPRSSRRLTSS